MVPAFAARLSTRDVDAIFQPAHVIRDIAKRIAEEHHLLSNWLNDGVKGFVSARHEVTAGNLPQFPHLHLTMPVPEYLVAQYYPAKQTPVRTQYLIEGLFEEGKL